MIYDLIYLLLLLTGVMILIENRLRRTILLTAIQGILLCGPVFQIHDFRDYHAWSLVFIILVFKTTLTPLTLNWVIKRTNMQEHTNPRFKYLATLFFFLIGLFGSIFITNRFTEIPSGFDKLELIYVFLLIYMGTLAFVVRRHWLVLIIGFIMFENGIFLLTLMLHKGLPFGVELGAFVDTILVIVVGTALQLNSANLKAGEKHINGGL